MASTSQPWEDPRFLNIYVMADLVNQPIHITTPDGIVRFVNKAWSIMYRKSPEEAIGQHIHNLLEKEHLNFYLSLKDETSKEPEKIRYEHFTEPKTVSAAVQAAQMGRQITCMTQTPDFRQMMVTATPIFGDDNKVLCVVTLVQDLTALGRWRDAIEREMQKNSVLQQELQTPALGPRQLHPLPVGIQRPIRHVQHRGAAGEQVGRRAEVVGPPQQGLDLGGEHL